MYGPHEIRRGAGIQVNTEAVVVNCQYSMAVFSAGERKRRPRGDRKSQEMTMHLRQVCLTLFFVGLIPTQGALTHSNFYCLPPLAEAVDKRALLFLFFFKSSLPFFCILSLRVETKTNRQFCNDPGTMCSTAMVTSEGSMI